MSLKKNPLILFVFVFGLILLFGIVGSIFLRSYKEKNSPEKFVDEISTTYESFPQIVNFPSKSIVLGSRFVFTPRIVPLDSSVKLTLLDAPEWLSLDGFVVSGTPKNEGSESFVLRIEKNGEYVDQEFHLVVTESFNE